MGDTFALIDRGFDLPGSLLVPLQQSTRFAGIEAMFAESAFARCEIDHRVAGAGFFDDTVWAVCYAVTAAIAYLEELRFHDRPGWA